MNPVTLERKPAFDITYFVIQSYPIEQNAESANPMRITMMNSTLQSLWHGLSVPGPTYHTAPAAPLPQET